MTSEQPARFEPQPDKVDILLVDDRPEDLVVMATILEGPLYNIVTARSGPEALKRLLEQDFAVILLDVLMPTIDGRGLGRDENLPGVRSRRGRLLAEAGRPGRGARKSRDFRRAFPQGAAARGAGQGASGSRTPRTRAPDHRAQARRRAAFHEPRRSHSADGLDGRR